VVVVPPKNSHAFRPTTASALVDVKAARAGAGRRADSTFAEVRQLYQRTNNPL
jgi:hypothetical protein